MCSRDWLYSDEVIDESSWIVHYHVLRPFGSEGLEWRKDHFFDVVMCILQKLGDPRISWN